MTRLTIATWNINSVRLRVALVLEFLEEYRPDVLCLQETRTADVTFPFHVFGDAGWPHAVIAGFKGRNGVAILSRRPFVTSRVLSWCGRDDGRHVQVTFPDGLRLDNIYVPAGGAIPDPEINDKFAHKLDFLEEMTDWITGERDPVARRILAGDFNIAPLENDVWSHKQLIRAVSHTPVEVETLARLSASHDWTDVVRHFVPASEKLYSWWPYRSGRDWSAKDHGRRLDHIWVTPALVPSLRSCQTLRHMREHEQPSDHVPVVATLEFPG
ncbi:MAG: exodeoxyribonuclease III [Alphaproteobacteria bacterium]|nr:exodeoxyribonuclease III [Alphaproteobacteria bacterium]